MHKPMINKKVSLISQERHAAKTVSEMKHFVSKLPHLQQMRQSLSVRKYHQAFVEKKSLNLHCSKGTGDYLVKGMGSSTLLFLLEKFKSHDILQNFHGKVMHVQHIHG